MPTAQELQAAIAAVSAGNQTAEQAAMVNAAYNQNALPITPAVAQTSGYTQEQQADAAYEAAKHQRLFHPQEYYGFQYADVANMPLSQIAARYGEGAADATQSYYQQHPSARAQAIVKQYEEQQSFVNVGYSGLGYQQGTIVPNVLAGEGGFTGRAKEYKDQWQPLVRSQYDLGILPERTETVPVRDLSSGMLSGSKMVAALEGGRTVDIYSPWGEFTQTKTENAKGLLGYNTGELGIYVKPYGHSTYMLTGGGGRNALQSGMFSVDKALTPYVVDRGDVGSYVLPSGTGMSRLGAEAYGGFVRPLDDRTLAPNDAISRFGEGANNLANFVAQVAGGKAEAPGAKIPWSVGANAPALQYMDQSGVIAGSAIEIPGAGRIVGSKTVASVGGASDIVYSEATAKQPFVSARYNAAPESQNEYVPSGLFGLGGLLPTVTREQFGAYVTASKSRPLESTFEMQGAMLSPAASVVGGVASRLTFGLSEFVYKPTPIVEDMGSTRSAKVETFDLPTTRDTAITKLPESSTMSGGNQTITDLGIWLTGSRESIDRTNPAAVKGYNEKADLFNRMQQQNPVIITTTGGTKEVVTETGGSRTVTTEFGETKQRVYASEWDKFVEGSGRVARYVTGLTEAKQAAYFETIKTAPGVLGEVKRGVFYFGTETINKPAELAPAAILGYGLGRAAGMVPGFLGQVGAGTGLTAKAATFLETPGGASIAKAGAVGVFGGAYTWGVTEGLLASPEKTKENIYRSGPALAAMYGGAGGFNWIGETRIVRGGSNPAGATFSGVQIQDTYFGGGRTPTGQRYAGAFSPVESYVVTGNVPVPAARPVRLGLPDLSKSSPAGYTDAGVGGEWVKPMQLPSEPTPMRTVQQSAGGMYARPEAVRDMTWDRPLVERNAKGYSPSDTTGRITEDFYARSTVPEPYEQKVTWKEWAPETQLQRPEPYNPLNPKRVYAEREPIRMPFSIPGVSDSALQAELANMHPSYREEIGLSTRAGEYPQTLIEREYPYTRVERESMGRRTVFREVGIPGISGLFNPEPSDRRQMVPATPVSPISTTDSWSRITPGGSNWRRTTEITTTRTPGVTDITTPYSRQTVIINPFRTTTPRERNITDIIQQESEVPWKRITETPQPTKTITPFPPTPITPLTGLPGGGWPGGAGGATPGIRKRRAAFTETFNMGLDMGFFARKGRASKSYTTPAKYRRKPKVAAKPKAKGGKKK